MGEQHRPAMAQKSLGQDRHRDANGDHEGGGMGLIGQDAVVCLQQRKWNRQGQYMSADRGSYCQDLDVGRLNMLSPFNQCHTSR